MAAIRREFAQRPVLLDKPETSPKPVAEWFWSTAAHQQPHLIATDWRRIAPATVETAGITRVPSDDWPFLYLREATNTCAESAQYGVDRRTFLDNPVRVFAGSPGAAELADVLPGCRIHAPRNQGCCAYGPVIRFHLARQLGGILRHPGDDPRQQSLCAAGKAAENSGRTMRYCRLLCWSTSWCR